MKILAIETSCDETALALVSTQEKNNQTKFKILANEVSSQIAIHAQFGGVFPAMAKREHSKNILNILENVLSGAKKNKKTKKPQVIKNLKKIEKILEREGSLCENFISFISSTKKPDIDAIAVTTGPGLEPALWVGISFAKALSLAWEKPLISVNHMEGHIFSVYPDKKNTFTVKNNKDNFPSISLLVSGGHTEIVLMKDFLKYKIIGKTRDDAAGEAFDKVARMLDLPYPGGPEISKLAAKERELSVFSEESKFLGPRISSPKNSSSKVEARPDHKNFDSSLSLSLSSEYLSLPRPMINSKDYDFSFSGLKTAVLYMIRDLKEKYSEKELEKLFGPKSNWKQKIACEFENSVVEVLSSKTLRAIKEHKAKTLIVGGGVSANNYLQETFKKEISKLNSGVSNIPKIQIHFPSKQLTGDNALMIAIAGYYQFKNKKISKNINLVKANGNLSL